MKSEFSLYEAITLARDAHKQQKDKIGMPYIYHPISVMLMLESEPEMIVAMLHDVVEDTEVSLEDIRNLGASEEILDAIDAITKKNDEDYDSYLARVRSNPLARRVKLMDATHNRLPERLAQLDTLEKQEKFKLKYDRVIGLMQ